MKGINLLVGIFLVLVVLNSGLIFAEGQGYSEIQGNPDSVSNDVIFQVAFKPGTGVNTDKLESICSEDFCYILDNKFDKTIRFHINKLGYNIIAESIENKESGNTRLTIRFIDEEESSVKKLVPIGLNLMIENDLIYGVSKEDVEKISEIIKNRGTVYYKPSDCPNSYFRPEGEEGDEGKSGWLVGGCQFIEYNSNCPYLSCCGDYARGVIGVAFGEGVSEGEIKALMESYGLTYTMGWNPGSFIYKAQILEGNFEDVKNELESNDMVLEVNDMNVNDPNYPDAKYLILVKFNSSFGGIEEADELINAFENLEVVDKLLTNYLTETKVEVDVPYGKEEQWVETFENEEIVKATGLVGPSLCVHTAFSFLSLPTSLSDLQPLKLEGTSNSIYYWAIGIIAVAIIILFLIFKKKR